MIVIVAEKPSVGRDIARVLGCKQNGEGFIAGERYTVTWAVGHLVTLCEPDEIDEKYKKWRMDDLPILPEVIPTKVIGKTKKQFTVIKKLINDKDTERVICATDLIAHGAMRELREAGKKIPKDVSVAGVGDHWADEASYPPLTTVKLFFRDCGRTAVELLLSMIRDRAVDDGGNEKRNTGSKAMHVKLGYDIVERGSM